MKRVISIAVMSLWILASGVLAEVFKPYPGAKPEVAASAAASAVQAGTQVQVFMTNDNFDKVSDFYKGLYKEYKMSAQPPKLESGRITRWSFFILDGGKDLGSSQHWMKVQRPYIGSTKVVGGKPVFSDIRDVTVIEVVHKK